MTGGTPIFENHYMWKCVYDAIIIHLEHTVTLGRRWSEYFSILYASVVKGDPKIEELIYWELSFAVIDYQRVTYLDSATYKTGGWDVLRSTPT